MTIVKATQEKTHSILLVWKSPNNSKAGVWATDPLYTRGGERAGWDSKAFTRKGTIFLYTRQWRSSWTTCVSANWALSCPQTCVYLENRENSPNLLTHATLKELSQFKGSWHRPGYLLWKYVFTFFKSSRSIFSIPSSWSTLEARVGEESLLLGTRKRPRRQEPPQLGLFGTF